MNSLDLIDDILSSITDGAQSENEIESEFPEAQLLENIANSLEEPPPIEPLIKPEKIMINIGGQMFNLRIDQLSLFKIAYDKIALQSNPFVDRDPKYFIKIIDVVSKHGFSAEQISANIENYSAQFINELCKYDLLDANFKPKPKVILTKNVTFNSDKICHVVVQNETFVTNSTTLLKSSYFEKLDLEKKIQVDIPLSSEIFRYILHLLRDGELFYLTPEILSAIKYFEIDHKICAANKIHETVAFVPKIEIATNINQTDKLDNLETCQSVLTKSKLSFGSDLVFDLSLLGNCLIMDVVLCVDLPIVKISDPCEYVDNMPYILIETVKLFKDDKPYNQILGNYLFYERIMFNAKTEICSKYKILSNNQLIDINRIFAPIYLISKPIANSNLKIIVKLAQIEKFLKFTSEKRSFTLLNAFLMVKLKNHQHDLTNLSINSLCTKPFHRVHLAVKPIEHLEEEYFNICKIDLSTYANIVDFYFSLHSKESTQSGMFDYYLNDLVEYELTTKSQTICRIDTISNQHFYKSKFSGNTNGIYYHYFCYEGIPAQDLVLRLKILTKKIEGFVLIYIREAI
jgi:hypothetical protein